MTADEYLEVTGKKPYAPTVGPNASMWYWGLEEEADRDPLSDDYDMVVPPDVFAAMDGNVTYPNCHVYRTKAEALEAFRKAWNKTRS